MPQKRFQTQYNSVRHKHYGEVNRYPSATVPDQTMTVREILNRQSAGLQFSDGRVPIFDTSDEYLPDPRKMDLADREEFADLCRDRLYDLKKQMNEKAEALRKKEADAEAEQAELREAARLIRESKKVKPQPSAE